LSKKLNFEGGKEEKRKGGKEDAHLPGDGERDALVDRVLRRFFPGIRCNNKKLSSVAEGGVGGTL
jgi:hypothetical protein